MMDRLNVGDVVQHFKREMVLDKLGQLDRNIYLYKILAFAEHTETKETMVVYRALYASDAYGVHFQVYVRPYDMFMSEVDHEKYPNVKQKYRFERYAR